MAHIAWIEDDSKRVGSLVALLEKEGHQVISFNSWQEINGQVETILACDLVLLDVILPPVEDDPYMGLSVMERLRKIYNYAGPIVVCSRVKNPAVLDKLKGLGVAEVLRKPVRPSDVYKAVKDALERPKDR